MSDTTLDEMIGRYVEKWLISQDYHCENDGEVFDQALKALHALCDEAVREKWIKVKDRLPKPGEPCVYYFKHVGVWGGKYIGMTEWGPQFASMGGVLTGDVTHWMPLPKSPVEQGKKEG